MLPVPVLHSHVLEFPLSRGAGVPRRLNLNFMLQISHCMNNPCLGLGWLDLRGGLGWGHPLR